MWKMLIDYLERRKYAAHWTNQAYFISHYRGMNWLHFRLRNDRAWRDAMRRAKEKQKLGLNLNIIR